MIPKQSQPDGHGRDVVWQYVSQMINDQFYDQLEEFLHNIETHASLDEDTVVLGAIQAALKLNHSCRECSARSATFRLALEETNRQHQTLVSSLTDIVRTVLDYTGDSLIASLATGSADALPQNGKPPPLQRLWQSIQNFFAPLENSMLIAIPPNELQIRPPTADRTSPESVGTDLESPIEPVVDSTHEPAPQLTIYCLGLFRVYYNDHLIENWSGRKCKSLLKYLVSAQRRSVAKEVLMELFWPESDPDAARNNLNVTIYGLRQTLRETNDAVSYVLFQDDCYLINPDLVLWVDSEVFLTHVMRGKHLEQAGQIEAAIREFGAAEALYQGEFMEDDRYEDWVLPHRQHLREHYLTLLNRLSMYFFDQGDLATAITMCRKILSVDKCHESAHRYLMACYQEQGQNHLALRQYHLCTEILHSELNASPSFKTTELYRRIRNAPTIGTLKSLLMPD